MERLKSIFEKLYTQFPMHGNLVFIDLETTGFEKDAKIIEIGAIAVKFNGFDIEFEKFESLIHPMQKIASIITEVTGITNDDLVDAPGDEEVYGKFKKWFDSLSASRIVAHNARFDESKLKYNLYRTNTYLVLPEFVCTMEMSRKILKDIKNDKLKTVAEKFNFLNNQAHRALADTEVCAFVYAKMILGEVND